MNLINFFLIISITFSISCFCAENTNIENLPLMIDSLNQIYREDLYKTIQENNILYKINQFLKQEIIDTASVINPINPLIDPLAVIILDYYGFPKDVSDLEALSIKEINNLIKFYYRKIKPYEPKGDCPCVIV